jgi:hypothetical protein
MTTTSQELQVLDRRTGELLDVREAETEQLAAFDVNAQELRAEIADAQAIVSDELVRRLDRDLLWTQRFGDPKSGAQFEVKTASPAAGTDVYNPVILWAELVKLIARNTIS